MKKLIFLLLLLFSFTQFLYASEDIVVCTADAKLCSDGTWVGRSGPNCEFVCPTENTYVCTAEYAPVCASVEVQCIKAPCDKILQTFGNKCEMENNKNATFMHEGSCEGANDIGSGSGVIGMPNPAAVNCTEKGGELVKDGDLTNCAIGGQTCEQWAYYRGECNIEIASKLEAAWNILYEKYTKNKSLEYKKALLNGLTIKLEDLALKETTKGRVSLYNHLSYLVKNTLASIK